MQQEAIDVGKTQAGHDTRLGYSQYEAQEAMDKFNIEKVSRLWFPLASLADI